MANEFGDWMKKERTARGLTLEDVAKKCGTHKGYISGIENDKVNPPAVKLLRKIALLFGSRVEEVILRAEIEKLPPQIRNQMRAHLFLHPVPWANFDLEGKPVVRKPVLQNAAY